MTLNEAAYRRNLKRGMPNVGLEPRHTEHGRLLPNRLALLDLLPKHGIVAELGVADGDFSAEILTRCAPAHLHLVDTWHSARYADGRARIWDRFADSMARGEVSVHRGLSVDVLAGFADGSLDWVYIDTTHAYSLTATELRLCHDRVTAGGRICGHDFCTGNIVTPVVYGVIQAVNEFCVRFGWQYEYLTLESHGHFSFCLKRL